MAKVITPKNDIEIWKSSHLFLEDAPISGEDIGVNMRELQENLESTLRLLAEENYFEEPYLVPTPTSEKRIKALLDTGDLELLEGYAYEVGITVKVKPIKKFRYFTGIQTEDF